MAQGYISIGSNIDKDVHIPASINGLGQQFGALTLSGIYQTAAVGFDGDDFYNLVVGFDSALPVADIVQRLKQMELDNGRTRNCQKCSPRTLDLDLLLYGDVRINETDLQIPRPDFECYAYVLQPLAEIAPDLIHPTLQLSYAELWRHYDKTELKQMRVVPDWLAGLAHIAN